MNKGIIYAIGAYLVWGLFPVYWKWLNFVPALQLLSHRIFWSFVLMIIILMLLKEGKTFLSIAFQKHTIKVYCLAALLIGVNWLIYVWAVTNDHIVEASLGYFINPLLSVLLGVIFLRERLRLWQWGSISLATVGVAYLTITHGKIPWIALSLASTFALYGLVKKKAPLNAEFGLTLETGILFLPAALYLVYAEISSQAAFLHYSLLSDFLLIGAGLVTTIPLLMFSSAAHRIPLSQIGILQYLSPTLQFLLGVFVYHEAFTFSKFIGFCFVWFALVIFAIEGYVSYRSRLALASSQ